MKRIFTILLLAVAALSANAGVIVLEGHYQGKNLYVQNPFAGSGVGFCTFEVTINGEVTTDEVNSSAFEIDFANFQLKVGDPVIVKIKHKDDCKPKVLNPEVLKPKSTFEIVSMDISKEGSFSWVTKNETGKLTYIIEQYRWNKWIKVGEVDGQGSVDENKYEFNITPHSGENKFRVKQVDYSSKPRYSQAARYISTSGEVTFSPIKAKDFVTFTGETLFEVYDSFGNIVKKGFGEKVDVTNLKKGIYYLNYDNKTDTFVKK
ncbi:MAG: hypothetical protein KDD29_02010 [Flavobacteriales bacterium]|nr:hypothetical protein [Flavobacteriales bacterium]